MPLLTVAAFARQEHLSPHTVRRLIATDPEFPVVDISQSGTRPRYRVVTELIPAWARARRQTARISDPA
jgi:hypothetical protein